MVDKDKVFLVRLISGEEIVATVETQDGLTVLHKPHVVVVRPAQDNTRVQVALLPWVPYKGEDDIAITDHSLVFVTKPHNDMLAQYQQAVSEIALPDTKLAL